MVCVRGICGMFFIGAWSIFAMCLCCVYVWCVFEISVRCGICVVYVLFRLCVCGLYNMCQCV